MHQFESGGFHKSIEAQVLISTTLLKFRRLLLAGDLTKAMLNGRFGALNPEKAWDRNGAGASDDLGRKESLTTRVQVGHCRLTDVGGAAAGRG